MSEKRKYDSTVARIAEPEGGAMSPFEQDCMTYRGAVLTGVHAHWCAEWDDLPIDETCPEWPCCHLAYATLPRKLKKFAQAGFPGRRVERLVKRFHRATPHMQRPKLTGEP